DVYNIPVLLLIGWRGEPGVRDEPQHIKQGKITLSLLECLGIDYMVAGETENIDSVWEKAASVLGKNKPFAVVVKKDIFSEYKLQRVQEDVSRLEKERAIEIIVGVLRKDDLIVATTGTISRELFEIREKNGQSHANDFLAVGSMGHTSQIALGIAASRWDRTVYCFDGDGSVLMHMGSLAVNASLGLKNFRHIVFNNGAHDSVGGQPTAAVSVALSKIVVSCGYKSVLSADNEEDLLKAAEKMAAGDIQFLEVLVRKGSRKNLVRPTISPRDCKKNFMAVMHKK
ncbi:MAG: phosphonopyruvate decarboxylase, partial [Deltaproteobacteria bacterium]|nr:phosphonopyruvate decarboxylase [Deltaproteobacteria bacterium]